MECENSEASWETWTADSCNEQVSLEHSGALRDALKKLWWDVNRWRTQGLFRWRIGQTWVWGWISCAQGYCLRMPASLQQTDINPPESSSLQYHNHTGLCTNIWSWWQWGRPLLQETVDQTPKKDILVVQGDLNAKVGKDAQADWGEICGPYCNVETNERGLRLLEFATFNNLVLTNTPGPQKPSRRWTWRSPDGKHHNQIDYILVKKRFRSGVNIHRTRSFPGADIGSDHDLVMMTFHVRLKKARKPN